MRASANEPSGSTPRRGITGTEPMVFAAILVLALVLRTYGLRWGLPAVYEEATPVRVAWGMAGWTRSSGVDLNPHFFNYPSLMFYVHLAAQYVVYAGMHLTGAVSSSADAQIRCLVDPAPFVLAGRVVSVMFSLGAVILAGLIARRIGGPLAAALSALFVAVNAYFIERSQMIEVDVPLTFWMLLTLWGTLRLRERPNARRSALVGVAAGLAASTKYTGAVLIVPIVVAHFLARRGHGGVPAHRYLAAAVTLMVLCFVATSPFVLLDIHTFLRQFAVERAHMSAGHFGLGDESSVRFYAGALTGRLLGWPLTLLALAGFTTCSVVRRREGCVLLAAFLVPYVIAVSTWTMHADRYLLPALPILVVFAALGVEGVAGRLDSPSVRTLRRFGVVLLVMAVAFPALAHDSGRVGALGRDPRAAARDWIEANVPPGSYIVSETYGPDLFDAGSLLRVPPEIRQDVLDALGDRPAYPIHTMQMFQAKPQASAVFYNLVLYPEADYIVTTSAVRGRYERDPDRFRVQNAFYDALDREYVKVATFGDDSSPLPRQIIYRNPSHRVPFGRRGNVAEPRPIAASADGVVAAADRFYLAEGLNYEVYFHLPEAIACYELGLEATTRPDLFSELVNRKTSCLLQMRRAPEAMDFLDDAIERAPDGNTRSELLKMRNRIAGGKQR